MGAPPAPNFLTLACADVERMAGLLRALGWPEASGSEPAHRVFQCTNGLVVALYDASNYEPHFGPRAAGFRGFTLGVNLGTPEEVDAAYAALQAVPGARAARGAVRLASRLPGLQLPRPGRQPLGRRLEARLGRHRRRRPDLGGIIGAVHHR